MHRAPLDRLLGSRPTAPAVALALGAMLVAGSTLAGSSPAWLFDAEALEANLEQGVVVLREVVLVHGALRVCCPRARAQLGVEGPQRVRCRGGVVIARGERTFARSQKAGFDLRKNVLTLSGDVVLTVAGGTLRAERIEYDIDRDTVTTRDGRARFRQSAQGAPVLNTDCKSLPSVPGHGNERTPPPRAGHRRSPR